MFAKIFFQRDPREMLSHLQWCLCCVYFLNHHSKASLRHLPVEMLVLGAGCDVSINRILLLGWALTQPASLSSSYFLTSGVKRNKACDLSQHRVMIHLQRHPI